MAVLNAVAGSSHLSPIRSVVSSTAEDPSPSLPTRVVLPGKKPLIGSTGVAPGEHGSPPTTSKLRKYWGSGDADPVAATDDFIWNKEFMGHMQRLLDKEQAAPIPIYSLKEKDSGFLSLNRALNLDSIEIDLSKELGPPLKPAMEQQVDAAMNGLSITGRADGAASRRWRFVPTRREQTKWDRANKAATGGSDVILRESKKTLGDPKVLAAESREQYIKLKQKLQMLTISIGGIGVASAYFSYSPEIALSFGAGLLGSLAYIRMLGSTIDSMAHGSKGFVKGAAGQPRLLVPVVLVMMYNRWNEILVPEFGILHLELIPILLGFFTYKAATFVQAIQEALSVDDGRSSS